MQALTLQQEIEDYYDKMLELYLMGGDKSDSVDEQKLRLALQKEHERLPPEFRKMHIKEIIDKKKTQIDKRKTQIDKRKAELNLGKIQIRQRLLRNIRKSFRQEMPFFTRKYHKANFINQHLSIIRNYMQRFMKQTPQAAFGQMKNVINHFQRIQFLNIKSQSLLDIIKHLFKKKLQYELRKGNQDQINQYLQTGQPPGQITNRKWQESMTEAMIIIRLIEEPFCQKQYQHFLQDGAFVVPQDIANLKQDTVRFMELVFGKYIKLLQKYGQCQSKQPVSKINEQNIMYHTKKCLQSDLYIVCLGKKNIDGFTISGDNPKIILNSIKLYKISSQIQIHKKQAIYKTKRAFFLVVLAHQIGHYLVRKFFTGITNKSFTDQSKLKELESGYIAERHIFGEVVEKVDQLSWNSLEEFLNKESALQQDETIKLNTYKGKEEYYIPLRESIEAIKPQCFNYIFYQRQQ